MADRALERKVRAIWSIAPDAHCKGLCQTFCGIIPLDPAEEAVYDELGITIGHHEDGTCDKLVMGRCSIYEDRPLICRMWGAVDQLFMTCPHGCGPLITVAEAYVVFKAMGDLA